MSTGKVYSNAREVREAMERRMRLIQGEVVDSMERSRERFLGEVKKVAPEFTGEFKESITYEGAVNRYELKSDHQKAEYIISGTEPSEGIYIKMALKFVGRRLTHRSGRKDIGMHPGTPKHPVFDEALPEIQRITRETLDNLVKEALAGG